MQIIGLCGFIHSGVICVVFLEFVFRVCLAKGGKVRGLKIVGGWKIGRIEKI